MLTGDYDYCLTFSVNGDLFHRWEDHGEDDVLNHNIPKWKGFAESLGERLGKKVTIPQAMTVFVYAMEDGAIEAVRGHWRGNLADQEVLDAVMAFVNNGNADLVDEVLADTDRDGWHEKLIQQFCDDRQRNTAYFVEHDVPSCWLPDYVLYDADQSMQSHINFENVPQWMKLAERMSERYGREFNFASVFELFMSAMVDDVFKVYWNLWRGCVHSDNVVEGLLDYMKTTHREYQEQLVEPKRWGYHTVEYARCKELGLADWRPPSLRDHEPEDYEG